MKTIVHTNRSRDKRLHIEAEGCIINITVGLTDSEGHAVTHIEVLCDNYSGEPAWGIPDDGKILKSLGVRVKQETQQEHENRRAYEQFSTRFEARMTLSDLGGIWFDKLNLKLIQFRNKETGEITVARLSRPGNRFWITTSNNYSRKTLSIGTRIIEVLDTLKEEFPGYLYEWEEFLTDTPICDRCYGEGEYDCPVCDHGREYSEDYIKAHFAIDHCEDGRVPCDQCNGSGKAPKIA